MTEVLDKTGLVLEALDFVVATGYGRINVPFADKQITEITCHARGIHAFFPTARTIIDIGGHDPKGIADAGGKGRQLRHERQVRRRDRPLPEVIADTWGS
jgi:activator of 2-hydroxyglutaryl-CoA dehydratase